MELIDMETRMRITTVEKIYTLMKSDENMFDEPSTRSCRAFCNNKEKSKINRKKISSILYFFNVIFNVLQL